MPNKYFVSHLLIPEPDPVVSYLCSLRFLLVKLLKAKKNLFEEFLDNIAMLITLPIIDLRDLYFLLQLHALFSFVGRGPLDVNPETILI